jgi:hypothetical protein
MQPMNSPNKRKQSLDVNTWSKKMVQQTPSGSILPPFNNRHHSLAPESFGSGTQPLINLNNNKI